MDSPAAAGFLALFTELLTLVCRWAAGLFGVFHAEGAGIADKID
jgi:hypothetical protein